MTNPTHKIGYKNNEFEVIEYHGQDPKRKSYLWVCKCICSNLFILPTDKLRSQKHCPVRKNHPPRHGLTKKGEKFHPVYRLWCNIKKRCYSSDPREFLYYQGKGIKVCEEWINDPLSFYNWAMKNGWEKGLSIDRIDANLGYEPSNCEFITRSENSRKAAVKMWQTRRVR